MSTEMKRRVDIFRAAEAVHMVSRAASKEASGGEEWLCRCGKHYRGTGALEKGRRHAAKKVLQWLDAEAAS